MNAHSPAALPRRVAALFPLALTMLMVACSSWSPVALPTPADTSWSIHHRLRVTDSTGTTTVGLVAVVRDTTLVVTGLDSLDHAFPLLQVTRLEREHSNILGTALLVWLTVGLIVAMFHPDPTGLGGLSGY